MKKNSLEGKGRITINGEPVNAENLQLAKIAVTDGLIRSLYGMRDSGLLSETLNEVLHQWSYRSPVTGETYGQH